MREAGGTWDKSYEWKAVTLLSIGFGLLGLDRWIIGPLFPFIMKDLNLDYSQIGALAGILAVCWGVSSILMGSLSDRVGRRRVLIPSLVLFSLLAGLSGFASSFVMLMLLRAVMGVTEGAYAPVSAACTAEASKPSRRGLNLGLQYSLFALLGLGFGPIIATGLLTVVPSWHYVFVIVALPGLVLAVFMHFVLRDQDHSVHAADNGERPRWTDVLRSRNVVVSLPATFCAMCCVFVIGAMMPSYLIDYLKLTPVQMGFVMSGIGFGGFLGEFAIPGLSDLFGRRTLAVLSFVVGAILVKLLQMAGADPAILFLLLFFTGFSGMGLLALFAGPVATEAVPPKLMASAIGLVAGAAEIFGGGIAPAAGGWIAQNFGIQHVLDLALGGLLLGLVLSFGLKESAPRLVGARQARAAAAVLREPASN